MGCSDEFGSGDEREVVGVMSDPKEPTIRIASCRGDGRCPECSLSVPGRGGLLPALCGCRVCGPGCWSMHERRLLTEALRRLHDQEACTFDANAHADAAINDMRRVEEERDAAIRERDEARAELAAGMRLDALGDRGSRERAERAEALLREVLTLSKCPAGAWCSCCAAIRTSLLAKIREVLGAK